jgi:hypothetical protein
MSSHGRDISVPRKMTQLASGAPSGTIVISQTPYPCRGLLVGTAGVLDVVMEGTTVLTGMPFIAGLNPGRFKELRGTANTVANVWAVY